MQRRVDATRMWKKSSGLGVGFDLIVFVGDKAWALLYFGLDSGLMLGSGFGGRMSNLQQPTADNLNRPFYVYVRLKDNQSHILLRVCTSNPDYVNTYART